MDRQVKIIYANEYYEDDYGSRMHVDASITDWETVTQEEYLFLSSNFWQLFPIKRGRYILLVKDEETVEARILQLKDLLKEQIAKDKERKAKEKAAKEAKAAKAIEKEKKKYEEMKKKFEGK
jgi:hypothetical protein